MKMKGASSSRVKHVLHCGLMLCFVYCFEFLATRLFSAGRHEISRDEEINPFIATFSYTIRALMLLCLPRSIFMFLGMFLYNAFPGKVAIRGSTVLAPFVCFRAVTRGNYPELVKRNLARNMETCHKAGMENFAFEVVSDQHLNLTKHQRVRELVVPTTYRCKSGALYKARALQYCLEDQVNQLGDSDWIVHLDEETILTEDSVRGILNFVCDGSHQVGQGLITYANERVVNWLTTVADLYRVAEDMGILRYQFKTFHRPLLGIKGSYLVTMVEAERKLTFDNGPDGSILEDVYFAMMAYDNGYSFDFIEGEMWEQSTFSVPDLLQQRKRWFQGLMLIVRNSRVPLRVKFFLCAALCVLISLPFNTLLLIMALFMPVPCHRFFDVVFAFVSAVDVYGGVYGVLKSIDRRRLGLKRYALCLVGAVCIGPFNLMVENTVIFWALFGEKHKFFVVDKDLQARTTDQFVV